MFLIHIPAYTHMYIDIDTHSSSAPWRISSYTPPWRRRQVVVEEEEVEEEDDGDGFCIS
jgi:hypothetical protein